MASGEAYRPGSHTGCRNDETIFEFEGAGSRAEIAAALRAITNQLAGSGPISLTAGDETVSIQPTDSTDFEVEVEREGEDGERQLELEIELEWREATDGRTESTGDAESREGEDAESAGGAEEESETREDSESEARTDVVDLGANHATNGLKADASESLGSLGTFEVFEDHADEWRWRLVNHNGNVIATSGEGYTRRRNAAKGLRSAVENAPGADVVDDL